MDAVVGPDIAAHMAAADALPGADIALHAAAGDAVPGPDAAAHVAAGDAVPGADAAAHALALDAVPGVDAALHRAAGDAVPGVDIAAHAAALDGVSGLDAAAHIALTVDGEVAADVPDRAGEAQHHLLGIPPPGQQVQKTAAAPLRDALRLEQPVALIEHRMEGVVIRPGQLLHDADGGGLLLYVLRRSLFLRGLRCFPAEEGVQAQAQGVRQCRQQLDVRAADVALPLADGLIGDAQAMGQGLLGEAQFLPIPRDPRAHAQLLHGVSSFNVPGLAPCSVGPSIRWEGRSGNGNVVDSGKFSPNHRLENGKSPCKTGKLRKSDRAQRSDGNRRPSSEMFMES